MNLDKNLKCVMNGKPSWVIGCVATDVKGNIRSSFIFKENEWDIDKLIAALKYVYEDEIDADRMLKEMERAEEQLIYQIGPVKSVQFKHENIEVMINTMAGQLID